MSSVLVELAVYNTVQLIYMLGYMGIDINEIYDQLARDSSSHVLIGPEPALGISGNVAMRVITDWMTKKHEEHWQSIHGQRQVKGFIKLSETKSWGIA